jgi:hypothetical protein
MRQDAALEEGVELGGRSVAALPLTTRASRVTASRFVSAPSARCISAGSFVLTVSRLSLAWPSRPLTRPTAACASASVALGA